MDYLTRSERFFRYGDVYIDRHLCARIPVHAHEFIELAYIASGSGRHMIGGAEYPCEKNDLFIIHPKVPHRFLAEKGGVLEIYNCIFRQWSHSEASRADGGFGLSFDFTGGIFSDGDLLSCPRVTFPEQARLGELFARMLEEYNRRPQVHDRMLHAYFMQLITEIQRVVPSTEAPVHGQQRRLEEVCAYIRANCHRSIALAELCRRCLLSQSHFSRLFKEYAGCGVKEYVQRCRIEKAKQLLLSTDLPVAQIAAMSGYRDVPFFGRLFRESTGQSPSRYRKAAAPPEA